MSDFPPAGMTMKEDSSQYDLEQEDNTIRSTMEGGYVFTRPRTTRNPKQKFKTGFSSITEADRTLLRNFYISVKAGASIFTWTDPTDGVEHDVRFAESIKYKYAGMGETRLYDVHGIILEEV